MKTLFWIISILLSNGGFISESPAQPVRVLISISKESVSHRFSHQVSKQLFKRGFTSEDFLISENADQYTLFKTLQDPSTEALIWISHGATPRLTRKMKRQLSSTAGMSAQPELIDYRGDNVAALFQNYSKNIRYLAVIGCNSKAILDYTGSTLPESIESFIPTKKIIAQSAIKKAVQQLTHVDFAPSPLASSPAPLEREQISITRSIPESADVRLIRPLRILIGRKLVGVIPAIQPGETLTWNFPIPQGEIKQVKVESGQNIMTPAEKVFFGDLQIRLPSQTSLKLFAKTNGEPFGLNFRLYILP